MWYTIRGGAVLVLLFIIATLLVAAV